jgi:hypothetical protein
MIQNSITKYIDVMNENKLLVHIVEIQYQRLTLNCVTIVLEACDTILETGTDYRV